MFEIRKEDTGTDFKSVPKNRKCEKSFIRRLRTIFQTLAFVMAAYA